jgi:prepilin-type N-terminal cleavage/methylation domain-containing protein
MNKSQKGFTLVELLVVIALIAVLAVAVILTLNPAELLKQGRDSTRISDLTNMNIALSLFFADVSTSTMPSQNNCYAYAVSGLTYAMCQTRFSGLSGGTLVTSSAQTVNGSGWLPINLTLISSGAPLPRYPIDPTNNNTYYYAFRASTTVGYYEINAILESTKYASQMSTDGGNNNNVYEVGTNLNL